MGAEQAQISWFQALGLTLSQPGGAGLYLGLVSCLLLAMVAGLLLIMGRNLRVLKAELRKAPLLAEELARQLLQAREALAKLQIAAREAAPGIDKALSETAKVRQDLQYISARAEQLVQKMEQGTAAAAAALVTLEGHAVEAVAPTVVDVQPVAMPVAATTPDAPTGATLRGAQARQAYGAVGGMAGGAGSTGAAVASVDGRTAASIAKANGQATHSLGVISLGAGQPVTLQETARLGADPLDELLANLNANLETLTPRPVNPPAPLLAVMNGSAVRTGNELGATRQDEAQPAQTVPVAPKVTRRAKSAAAPVKAPVKDGRTISQAELELRANLSNAGNNAGAGAAVPTARNRLRDDL